MKKTSEKPQYDRISREMLDAYCDIRKASSYFQNWKRINPEGKTEEISCDPCEYEEWERSAEALGKRETFREVFHKAWFRAAFGKDIEHVRRISCGEDYPVKERQAACLMLLQGNAKELDDERLRTLIYEAREDRKPWDVRFLEGVAKVIQEKPKMHGHTNVGFLFLVFQCYEKGMTFPELVQAIEENIGRGMDEKAREAVGDVRKQLKRHGLSAKDFLGPLRKQIR